MVTLSFFFFQLLESRISSPCRSRCCYFNLQRNRYPMWGLFQHVHIYFTFPYIYTYIQIHKFIQIIEYIQVWMLERSACVNCDIIFRCSVFCLSAILLCILFSKHGKCKVALHEQYALFWATVFLLLKNFAMLHFRQDICQKFYTARFSG